MDLGTPGGLFSRANAINDSSEVAGVGYTEDFRQVAFIWSRREGMRILADSTGLAEARDINNAGEVAGTAGGRPVRWTPGGEPEDLGHVLSAGRPERLNEQGRIAGVTDRPGEGLWNEGLIWNADTSAVYLGTMSEAGSEALGINDAGEVVGHSAPSAWDPLVAVLWNPGHEMVDLNQFAPSGWTFLDAVGINRRGDIAGAGFDGMADQAFILWKDVPSLAPESGEPVGAAGLRVWPNPARGPIRLAFTNVRPGTVRLRLLDPSGRLLRATTAPAGTGEINLSWDPARGPGEASRILRSLSRGIYFLEVAQPDGSIRRGRLLWVP